MEIILQTLILHRLFSFSVEKKTTFSCIILIFFLTQVMVIPQSTRWSINSREWEEVKREKDRIITYKEIIELLAVKAGYVIDVRTREEVEETGSLPSSINIPLNELQEALNMTYKDFPVKYKRDKAGPHSTIIFTCKSGKRSAYAVRIALAMGYSNPFNYAGGWLDWQEQKRKDEEKQNSWKVRID